jgi:hypothetical protein
MWVTCFYEIQHHTPLSAKWVCLQIKNDDIWGIIMWNTDSIPRFELAAWN